jgi:hypothetical protein
MGWYILANNFKVFLTLFHLSFRSDQEKDLEILILRHQINILERKHNQTVRADRVDRMLLSVLADRLKLISGLCWLLAHPPRLLGKTASFPYLSR